MSLKVMTWAFETAGEPFLCKCCSAETQHEGTGYHKMGVCGRCVAILANAYSCAHGSGPLQEFCSDAEWAEHLASKPQSNDRRKKPDIRKWRRLRIEVAARDGLNCHYCSKKMKVTEFEVDHIVPVSKGGSDELSNLVASCKTCNCQKGNRDYTGFCKVRA